MLGYVRIPTPTADVQSVGRKLPWGFESPRPPTRGYTPRKHFFALASLTNGRNDTPKGAC